MNRATRNKLVSGTDQSDLTTGNACWETPPLVFQKLNEDFGPFDVDLTADAQRALCEIWFGPGSPWLTDVLMWSWDPWRSDWGHLRATNGYSNPPYGPFIQRLLPAAKAGAARGFTSTLLLPMRVTKAFKAHVLDGASDLLFCDTRVTFFENGLPRLNEQKFIKEGKAVADPAVFDSIVVRYRPGVTTLNVGIWHMPKHVTSEDLARAFERRRLRDVA